MRIRNLLIPFVILALSVSQKVSAQQVENSAWSSWLSSFKVKDKWGAHLDIQLRSADEVRYVRNTIVRPGITYNFNKKQNATVGYAFVETFRRLDGIENNDLTEHRIWEQFIQTHKIKQAFATHRFRVEQRFIERTGNNDLFSQRFRYFARFVVPFKKYEESYKKGPYMALQNEVFLHLQNKDQLNKSLFDQNRAFLAIGTRLNPIADLEIGYLNQYINGLANNTINNILQIGLVTRL
jgi:hypothetical protein